MRQLISWALRPHKTFPEYVSFSSPPCFALRPCTQMTEFWSREKYRTFRDTDWIFKRPKIVDGVRVKWENNRKWNITLLRNLRKNKIAFHAHLKFLTFTFSLYLHYRNNQSSVDHKLTESRRALVTETETKYIHWSWLSWNKENSYR